MSDPTQNNNPPEEIRPSKDFLEREEMIRRAVEIADANLAMAIAAFLLMGETLAKSAKRGAKPPVPEGNAE